MPSTRDERRGRRPRAAVLVGVAIAVVGTHLTDAHASSWITALSAASRAQAQSLSIATPLSVTSSCPSPTTSKTVKVTWAGSTHASYTVYQSTTSATSGYSAVATGIATTSWTSGTLSNGTYWYEVAATYGGVWSSARSSATGSRTIASFSPLCS